MGKKMSAAWFPAPRGTTNNNELTAESAQDSMSMVTMAAHNPPIPAIPMAVRVFLACRMSRMTIMKVRRILSAIEIEKYGRPK